MLDYEFGRGTSRALPRTGLRFSYSRRSNRLQQVFHQEKLFATIRPNGAVAPSVYGATTLMASRAFAENSVTVEDEAVPFVRQGKSVFCKFVKRLGRHVLPAGEVVVLDTRGSVIAVGSSKLPGVYITQFKAGVAVKVRSALDE